MRPHGTEIRLSQRVTALCNNDFATFYVNIAVGNLHGKRRLTPDIPPL